jgi:hypothetical protein
MQKGIYMMVVSLLAGAFYGCTEQRDIYTIAHPALYIEGDWEPTLHTNSMSMDATALIYSQDGAQMVSKNFFAEPNSVVVPLTRGDYNVLLFNGMMYEENNTHLTDVQFRGTDNLDTFEAIVAQTTSKTRLRARTGDEYIASNEMDMLTVGHSEQRMNDEVSYSLKYKDGKNGYPTVEDYIEESLYLTPFAVSYPCQVEVVLTHASSAYVANGALRGFVGGVFMASRMPSHRDVTHQFKLNSFTAIGEPEDDMGIIKSPQFVTFGPPLDLPERKYTLQVSMVLVDGSEFEREFDITEQVLPVIEQLKSNLYAPEPIEVDLNIPIRIVVDLPAVEPSGDLDVGQWGDDEIIQIPIRPPHT